MCLFTLAHSPSDSHRFALCLNLLQPQDDLLLLGDALYGLWDTRFSFPKTLYGLIEDWQLRFNEIPPPAALQLIHYRDWVALSLKHPQSVAWN